MNKNYRLILTLILTTFFLKELFFIAIIPFLRGPDELAHYATTQYRSEPSELKWGFISDYDENGKKIRDKYFSEEIQKTYELIGAAGTAAIFSENSYDGRGESEIDKNQWSHIFEKYPPKVTDYPPLYHDYSTSILEKVFINYDIFIRIFFIRSFSIVLGLMVVLFSYLIADKMSFSKKESLLVAAIVSFQPMLSATAAIINPDMMLIAAFTIFIYGAVSGLRDGINWKNALIIILSAIAGVLTKGPGLTLVILCYPLLAYLIYKKIHINKSKFAKYFAIFSLLILLAAFLVTPKPYLQTITRFGESSHFDSKAESLYKYLEKFTFRKDRFMFTGVSYWGNFGSLEAELPDKVIESIWWIEGISALGIILLLLYKKVNREYLPEKKYIIFLILTISVLQLAIRFYDWRVFDLNGKALISTPGRYFLPNVAAHMILVMYGLGFFFKERLNFEIMLKTILVLMVILNIYSVFIIIIPKFYL